jgi:hypothetical protein
VPISGRFSTVFAYPVIRLFCPPSSFPLSSIFSFLFFVFVRHCCLSSK